MIHHEFPQDQNMIPGLSASEVQPSIFVGPAMQTMVTNSWKMGHGITGY